MSDSIHQTFRSVFGNKSKAEIDRMFADNDPEVIAYMEKRQLKKDARQKRKNAGPRFGTVKSD